MAFDPFQPVLGWPLWTVVVMALLSIAWLVVAWIAGDEDEAAEKKAAKRTPAFKRFQTNYLIIYLIIQLADWLQGTNMYTLYMSYQVDIGTLFVTGFATSGVCSLFVGPYIDRYGRKGACVVYCILEVIINTLEHFPNMALLLVGRVMGGLSTALLFTAVESWMVTEHRKQGHSEELLAETFSLASMGNGIVAVIAGILAQVLMDHLGEIGPFQAAIFLTIVALIAIVATWRENYGDEDEQASKSEKRDEDKKDEDEKNEDKTDAKKDEKKDAKKEGAREIDPKESSLSIIFRDRRILFTGLVQSLFEGAMYTFVFNWVPTMINLYPGGWSAFTRAQGLIFSCFMMCISIGGRLFSVLLRHSPVEQFSIGVFGVAAISMLVPVFSSNMWLVCIAFMIVELCVGLFFACSGTMRSMFIPESRMSTIMNIFRVPLNICVVIGTKLDNYVSSGSVFLVCFLWFGLSSLMQLQLSIASKAKSAKAE